MGPCILNIFQYISNKMQRYTVYLYVENALHISGGTFTHYQERIQLYPQYLAFVTPLLLSCKSWNRFECAVGGVRHPQHTQTSFLGHKTVGTLIYLLSPVIQILALRYTFMKCTGRTLVLNVLQLQPPVMLSEILITSRCNGQTH
jgi:hypothetical protein